MDTINTLTEKSLAKYFGHISLKAYATRADFEKLCREVGELGTAMVAINSAQVRVCKELLKGCDVHVGATIPFPLGRTVLEIKVEETKKAIQDGSDEINYVISTGEAGVGHWSYIEEEMRQITEICRAHKVISKVIFKNCYLEKEEIKKLVEIAKEVKPDYIKASTGFGTSGATLEDVRLIKETVGNDVKVRVVGSVRDWETCRAMIRAGAKQIGTSSSIATLGDFRNERGQQK